MDCTWVHPEIYYIIINLNHHILGALIRVVHYGLSFIMVVHILVVGLYATDLNLNFFDLIGFIVKVCIVNYFN